MKLPVVDRIDPQSNKFATGVGYKATGDSKLNDGAGAFNSGVTCDQVIIVILLIK